MSKIDPVPLVLDETNFDRNVLQSQSPVLVDFTASWCGPCRAIAPVIESLAVEYADRLSVASLDIDDVPAVADRFRIRSVPTVMLFADGEIQQILVGARSASEYRQSIDAVLG
jgi:thioredoxin 1